MLDRQRSPVEVGILVTFALAPLWLKWQFAPPPFTATYVLGFLIVIPLLFTVLAWLCSGFRGLRVLLQDRWRLAWFCLLWTLTFWIVLAQGWAFVAERHAGVAQNFALHMVLVSAFLVVVACAAPPLRAILAVLLFSLLVQGGIGAAQVARQGSLGLKVCGEFTLERDQSGTSVVMAGTTRWLRPYGCLPHPNIWAGVIGLGTFAAIAGVLRAQSVGAQQRARHALPLQYIFFAFGLYLLLLSFSRGAWLGFGVGVLVALYFVMHLWRAWLPLVGIVAIVGGLFFALYQPFILSRTGAGQETTEMRSLADRIVYTEIAGDIIRQYPLTGIGGANYPWYASYYLAKFTDYDLRGDNVHNIYLLIWSEFGLIGLALFLAFLSVTGSAIVRQIRAGSQALERTALLAGYVMFLVVGMFDHYPWTLIFGQVLWLGLAAAALGVTHARKITASD